MISFSFFIIIEFNQQINNQDELENTILVSKCLQVLNYPKPLLF